MKNKHFLARLGFATKGIKTAWGTEKSFRTQVVMGIGAIALLVWFRPAPLWWAIFIVLIGAVLAAELFNTALEAVVDRLHPAKHSLIAHAKDCAAGAVLVLSLGALGVLAAFLFDQLRLLK